MYVAAHLMQPTRKLGRTALKRFPIWSCTGRGLPSFSSHLENWCALTAPFHPYLDQKFYQGGLLSVALSFTSPRLHVMERPVLWCSDFPPGLKKPGNRFAWSGRILYICMIKYSTALRAGNQ